MAIVTCVPDSFLTELWQAIHNLDAAGDTIKAALYTSSANLGLATTAYTAVGECPAAGGYAAGGVAVVNGAVTLSGRTSFPIFSDPSWALLTQADIRGFMLYNSSKANRAIKIEDLGAIYSVSAQPFRIELPADLATSATLRIGAV